MSSIHEITSVDAFKKLLQNYHIVVLDHYGDWCQPCKYFAPLYETLANEYVKQYSGQRVIAFARCDAEKRLFELEALPTIQVYHNQTCVKTIQGADIDALKETIGQLIQGTFTTTDANPSGRGGSNTNPYSSGMYKPGRRDGHYRRLSDMPNQ